MADLKMPELNIVVIVGNLTKNPVFRKTSNGTPVVNFHIAANRKFRDSATQWQEDVCYVGVVAWNKLADSCRDRLKKGSAVLIEGELQSRSIKTEQNRSRTIIEIKAKRIQFLNKISNDNNAFNNSGRSAEEASVDTEASADSSDLDNISFNKFLTDEESDLINE